MYIYKYKILLCAFIQCCSDSFFLIFNINTFIPTSLDLKDTMYWGGEVGTNGEKRFRRNYYEEIVNEKMIYFQ